MSFSSLLRFSVGGISRTTTSLGARSAPSVLRTPLSARRWLSADARAKIDEAVNAKPLVLFMKGTPDAPQCGFSRAVVQILDMQGVDRKKMQTYNVLEDSELRSGIKEYSEWPTVPQVYVNGEFVGGCDILMGMHQSGELEDLLEKGSILPPIAPAASSTPSASA